jgi:hypothetical protein
MISILDLVTLAKAGANWEHGNSVGVPDDPEAARHAILMEIAEEELDIMVNFLNNPINKGIAGLPAISILKLRSAAP